MKTTVINLLGGSGIGKSTTAAGLFYHMKLMNQSCELVREYVKNWAWKELPIRPYDQFYITGKQSQYESILYNKVNFIITDSPIILGAIYDEFYGGRNIFLHTLMNFLDVAKQNDVNHDYFLLKRHKQYHQEGRYQTQEDAEKVDNMIEQFMAKHELPFKVVDSLDGERVHDILRKYGIHSDM